MKDSYYEQSSQSSRLPKDEDRLKVHYHMIANDYYLTGKEEPRFFEDSQSVKGWLYLSDPPCKEYCERHEQYYTKTYGRCHARYCVALNEAKMILFKSVMREKLDKAREVAANKGYDLKDFDLAWKNVPHDIPSRLIDDRLSDLVDIAVVLIHQFKQGRGGNTILLDAQSPLDAAQKLIPERIANRLLADELKRLAQIILDFYTRGLAQLLSQTALAEKDVQSNPAGRSRLELRKKVLRLRDAIRRHYSPIPHFLKDFKDNGDPAPKKFTNRKNYYYFEDDRLERAQEIARTKGYRSEGWEAIWSMISDRIIKSLDEEEFVDIMYLCIELFNSGKNLNTTIYQQHDHDTVVLWKIPLAIRKRLGNDEIELIRKTLMQFHIRGFARSAIKNEHLPFYYGKEEISTDVMRRKLEDAMIIANENEYDKLRQIIARVHIPQDIVKSLNDSQLAEIAHKCIELFNLGKKRQGGILEHQDVEQGATLVISSHIYDHLTPYELKILGKWIYKFYERGITESYGENVSDFYQLRESKKWKKINLKKYGEGIRAVLDDMSSDWKNIAAGNSYYAKSKKNWSEGEFRHLMDNYQLLVLDSLLNNREVPRYFEDSEGISGMLYINDPLFMMANVMVTMPKKIDQGLEPWSVAVHHRVSERYVQMQQNIAERVFRTKLNKVRKIARDKGYDINTFDAAWMSLDFRIPGGLRDEQLVEFVHLCIEQYEQGKKGNLDLMEQGIFLSTSAQKMIPPEFRAYMSEYELWHLGSIVAYHYMSGLVEAGLAKELQMDDLCRWSDQDWKKFHDSVKSVASTNKEESPPDEHSGQVPSN